jgi:hypothetical protein
MEGETMQDDSDQAFRERVKASSADYYANRRAFAGADLTQRGDDPGPDIDPKPKRHDYTRTLPRGCIAADRYGKPFIVWPNGWYGYDRESKCSPTYSSYSFGPYTVLREGLTAEQCDAFAEGDRLGVDVAEAGAA